MARAWSGRKARWLTGGVLVGIGMLVLAFLPLMKNEGTVQGQAYPYPSLNKKPAPSGRGEAGKANSPTRPPKQTASSAGQETVQRKAGAGTIVESGLAPLPGMVYTILNSWYEETPSKIILVYAGGKREHPGLPGKVQGIIVVRVVTPGYRSLPGESDEYAVPAEVGAVRVVDAQGERLTLVGEVETVLFFDVVSREFAFPTDRVPFSRSAGDGRVVESRQVDFVPPDGFLFENQWYQEAGGYRTTLLAGGEAGQGGNGVVWIGMAPSGELATLVDQQIYLTPVAFGPIRIVEVDGNFITLASADGARFVFDLAARRFVAWPDV